MEKEEFLKAYLLIRKNLEGIDKSGTNRFYDYKYGPAEPLIAKFQELLNTTGLVATAQYKHGETKDGNAIIDTTLLLSDLGDNLLVSNGIGEGADKGDKASYKGMTGGLKYAIRSMFMIPFKDEQDPEADSSVDVAASAVAETLSQIQKADAEKLPFIVEAVKKLPGQYSLSKSQGSKIVAAIGKRKKELGLE